jgi:DNA-binding MarR family transcriptional regulator
MKRPAGPRRAHTRAVTSPAHQALVGLLRAADAIRRRTAPVIEAQGITLQQFNVLRILRGAGDEGVATLEVANRMVEQTPGITRLLDRLEAKALVRRQRCPKDRRQHLCWITPQGLRVLEQLDEPVLKASDACVAKLTRNELATLTRLLAALQTDQPSQP